MLVVVMGVAGSGKSTVGAMLAEKLGLPFYDADDYHPPENKVKMAAGIPLDDSDREGWLAALAELLTRAESVVEAENGGFPPGSNRGPGAVLACSALKQKYRDVLRIDPGLRFVYLKGSYEQILERIQNRSGHFMKPEMLASQFAALEAPQDAIVLSVELDPMEIVRRAAAALRSVHESSADLP